MAIKATLSVVAAATLALALGGCQMGNSGPASATTVGGNNPSAAGGASGAGTQNGPSGGVGTGNSNAPAP
jgi:hypothetical protein